VHSRAHDLRGRGSAGSAMDRRISKFTLRRITCLTDCALALFCMLFWVPVVSGQQTSAASHYCSATFGPNGGETLAFSDSFEVPGGTDINRVRDDFVKFIREKYSAKDASGGCSTADNKAKEESNMRGHRKIIETGWKPVASGKGNPTYCSGAIRGGDMYFSDIFEVVSVVSQPVAPLVQ